MTLGQRISAYRKKAGISQEELGARLGVSRQAVSKWENDLTVPDMNNLLGLAREFGVSVAELTETPEEIPPKEHAPSPPDKLAARSSGRRRLVSALLAALIAVAAVLILQAARVPNAGSTSDSIPADQQPAQEIPSDLAPVENGDPDYSNRQDIYQEPVDATRQVYIAWNRLVTGENLSAEERYVYRSQVFSNLPDMDWQEFGKLGTSDDFAISEAFADWLREQTFSDSELFRVQVGLCADGLDGAYSENYSSLLASALFQNPVGYAKQLPRAAKYDEMVEQRILGATAYGADYYAAECASAVEALDAVIDTNALTEAENDWAKLLRYYLANPNNGYYADYPNTPEKIR